MESGKLSDELGASSRRLQALADRLAALRGRLHPGAPVPAAPLFPPRAGGGGALDEVELHFEVDDAEGGKRR
jgi:hypothetical protein